MDYAKELSELMKDCVIVDIDGTLADCHHRQHHVVKRPKNWGKFFDPHLMSKDPLIEPVAKLVSLLNSEYSIVYATGRPDNLRNVTIDWLEEHELWFEPKELYMRKNGDKRTDVIVKQEILLEIKHQGYNPWLCLDDRSSVVAMWRAQGLTCLQVAPGDF